MFSSELELRLVLGFLFLTSSLCLTAESKCSKGCDLALGSYYLWTGANFTFISQLVNTDIPNILSYNPQIPNQDSLIAGTRIVIPFSCDCLHNGDFLGHVFSYVVKSSDTYSRISGLYYSNLTTIEQLRRFNSYDPNNIPDTGVTINVTVNCSCGDSSVSKDYGLFITYPLLPVDTLDSIALASNLSRNVLQAYNPNANFSAGTGVVYIPGKDQTGTYPPLKSTSKSGLSGGAIADVAVGVAAAVIILLAVVFYILKQRKKRDGDKLLLSSFDEIPLQPTTPGSGTHKESNSAVSPGLMGLTVEKSVEFTYEELASATDDFSLANKIGQGGFGAVYYAELRSEKAAIKKMDMQATKEFLAELKVLTRVHHLNLVRLIGYCVQGSLFLVYEYIENGNLSQHLRRSGSRDPLSWSTRVQIALDSARGLEYIHEHTVPVYIHRDIKSANILIDKNFHAKVADFGLAKLTDVGSSTTATKVVGTFGYMPPEYAQYGDASPKVDVYAFGVVLYELISAKEAVIRTDNSSSESKGLVALFDEVLSQPEPKPDLPKLIDPRLGDDYPLDSVCKMAQLAKACTQENPQLRPSMRSIVVALMTLSSSTEDWDIGSFYDNQAFVNLMSGR